MPSAVPHQPHDIRLLLEIRPAAGKPYTISLATDFALTQADLDQGTLPPTPGGVYLHGRYGLNPPDAAYLLHQALFTYTPTLDGPDWKTTQKNAYNKAYYLAHLVLEGKQAASLAMVTKVAQQTLRPYVPHKSVIELDMRHDLPRARYLHTPQNT